jgi:plastocyanin
VKCRVAVVAVTVVAIGGLGGSASGGAKAPSKAKVKAVDFAFVDDTVKIRKGGKVTWKFVEGRHNVKGDGWKSPTQSSGKYSRKFKKVGKFKYRCTLHPPNMKGVVKVVKN